MERKRVLPKQHPTKSTAQCEVSIVMSLKMCHVKQITLTEGTLKSVNSLNYCKKQGISDRISP